MSNDALGNVYVTGYFISPTVIFDDDTLTNSSQEHDIFLVKYNDNGDVIWSRSIGGDDHDTPYSVDVDVNGNVYIAGFNGSSELIFNNDTLVSTGNTDVLLCKFDANGNKLWARGAKGNDADEATSVTTDNSGNIYITGNFRSSSIIFGTDTLDYTSISGSMFVVKYKPDGNIIWAKRFGGSSQDKAYSITADANGNIFFGGTYKSPYISFDSDTIHNNSNNGYSDIFLTKLDTAGNVLWAKSAGNYSDERVKAITTDISGNIYVSGIFFSSTFNLGTTTLVNSFLDRADVFTTKFNTSGQVLWAKCAGGNNDDQLSAIATDASENVIISMTYNSPSIKFGTFTFNNAGLYDGALAKYDKDGNFIWAKGIGGNIDDGAFAVAVNSLENIFTAGYYQSSVVVFDSLFITSPDTNYSTVYVAKLEAETTGEKNIEKQEFINVYPNPCNGIFTVESTYIDNNSVLSVYNIFGDRIFFKVNPSISEQVDISGYSRGIYLVKLETKNFFTVIKMIKE
ncbi:MAG TPA: SBBP repeat-containing protein [Bacteroidales bacterium]|nr:SBBP repeat-containing protein [Bacteroidales bacterium]HPS17787.1 SBBP repeat-containing protein [Bacteroidales bacterium]